MWRLRSPHSNPGGATFVILLCAAIVATTAGATAAPPAPPQVEVTGATRVEFDESSGTWELEGRPVLVTRGPVVLQAPKVRYDTRAQIVTAWGGVAYRDNILAVSAASVTLWLLSERAIAEGQVTAVRQDGERIELRAARVELSRTQGQLIASGGAALTRGTAAMTADWITYDDPARRAVASGTARVETVEGKLAADRIEALLITEELTADGHVLVVRGDLDGRADHAVLRQQAGIIELFGGAVARLGRNTIGAPAITIDLRARRITATGGAHLVGYPAAPP